MSFRSKRYQLVTLTILCLPFLFAGCATLNKWRDSLASAFEGESQTTDSMPRPVNGWHVIDGGVVAGNRLTGLEFTRLKRPVAISVRGQWLYIIDADLDKLFRYDLITRDMVLLQDLRRFMPGDARDLFVTSQLDYYIADFDGASVLHFGRDGQLIEKIHDPVNIGRPVGLYVDESRDRLFIADGFNDDVLVYNQSRGLVSVLGGRGDRPGEFRRITGFAASATGYYVTTRFGAHRIWRFGTDGRYLEALQKDTITFPKAVIADDRGKVFAADYLNNTISVYQGQRMLKSIGQNGSAPGQFRRVTDLWLDQGVLYVADSLNGRIQWINLNDIDIP